MPSPILARRSAARRRLSRKFWPLAVAFLAGAAFGVARADAAPAPVERPPLPSPVPKIVIGPCPGLEQAGGCADPEQRTVYVRGVAIRDIHDRFAVLHEIGHVFDHEMLDAGERGRFARLIGKGEYRWTWNLAEGGVVVQAPGTPAEDFADAYAACRLGLRPEPGRLWIQGYEYNPSPRRHRQVCGMIARAGLDAGRPVSADGDR